VVFDRVFVPWERVFVYRDVALVRAQFYETEELRTRQAELLALCSRLVQIPIENPPGDTSAIVSFETADLLDVAVVHAGAVADMLVPFAA
jgi:hypothetical protein